MSTRQKASIALEYLSGNISLESLVNVTGFNASQIKSISSRLKKNSYMTVANSFLDVALSALGSNKDLTVVQVGANDGKEGDPVFSLFQKYAIKALLIEPMPELIKKLQLNYRNFKGKLIIENVAVGIGAENLNLWRLKPEYWDQYVQSWGAHPTQITSFDPTYLLKKISARLNISEAEVKDRIEKLTCPMITLSNLLFKHEISHVDFLQVDCEGYDVKVIESLGDIRPNIINFESKREVSTIGKIHPKNSLKEARELLGCFAKNIKMEPICNNPFNEARECLFRSKLKLRWCRSQLDLFEECYHDPVTYAKFEEAGTKTQLTPKDYFWSVYRKDWSH
jgi:FkbM family methyltransferase